MKPLILKRLSLFLFGMIAFMLAATAIAQSPIDSTLFDPSNPGSIIAPTPVTALTTAIVTILTFISGIFPGIKKIKWTYVRTVVVVIITAVGASVYKLGFLNEGSLDFVLRNFLPTFGGSAFVWATLKFLLQLIFKIDLTEFAPGVSSYTKKAK